MQIKKSVYHKTTGYKTSFPKTTFMEQHFDESKGDLKYILEEQIRKSSPEQNINSTSNHDRPKKKYTIYKLFLWFKHLFFGLKRSRY